jgi:APA family basic amino acid/polyamine antiporter
MAPPDTASSARSGPDGPRLVRAIGRWDFTALVVNGVIGSGIFGLPAVLAGLTGAWSPLAYLLSGIGMLAIVLCHAEVASRFTEAGGPYLYAREAFGPFVGVQAGWLSFCIRVTSMGANLNIFTDYLTQILPAAGQGRGRIVTLVVVTAIVTVINVVGVRTGARTVDLFVVAKVLPLLLLVVLGLPRFSSDVLASQRVADPDWTQAILLLVFAYGGFEAALIPAGEMKDPRRDAGFALLTGMGLVAVIYMLVQVAVIGVLPNAVQFTAPVAATFGVLLGPAGVTLGSLAAMVSTYGWTLGSTLNSPRILYSMGERRELPVVLARVHPRFRTPHVAILVYAAAGLGFAAYGTFAANATLAAIVRLVTYGLVAAGLLVFRRRALEPPGFRLPMAGIIAPVALAFCVWLLSTRTFTQAWILLAMMAVGAALWLVSALGARRAPAV